MTAATQIDPRKLRVVHLCTPARVGGLERVVQSLARGLAGRGHEVSVVAIVASAADAEPFFTPFAGSRVQLIPLEFGAREYGRERRVVRTLLRDLAAQVLHTHGYRGDLLHGGPARRAGVATVSTVHGSSRMGGLSHLFEWMQLRALRRFDGVIAVSAPLQRSLHSVGVPSSRLHLVPNAIVPTGQGMARDSARAALGLPRDETPVIGWVGRLVPVKAADVFLEALARMPGLAWTASIIGDGPERAALAARATRLGIAERVRFHGEVDDAARHLPAFDAFALSSRSEGTPIAVIEAMQAGVPVVATAVGGVPDLLGEGNGWLVAPESPRDLAAALTRVLQDAAEAARRRASASARVAAEFDSDRWCERHEAIYGAALARRGTPR